MFFRRLKYKINDIIFDKRMRRQRYKKGYADVDYWNMHYWICDTFVKMLTDLRNTQHGYSDLEFEEVDNFPIDWKEKVEKELREAHIKRWGGDYDEDNNSLKWDLILTRIIWCLNQASDELTDIPNEYEEEYMRQSWGEDSYKTKKSFKKWWKSHFEVIKTDEKGKPQLYRLKEREVDPELKEKYFNRMVEISNFRTERKDEAFDLIKKYFYCLWD